MHATRMDRKIYILQPVEERNSSTGELTREWVVLARVWARKVPKAAAERVVGSELVSMASVVWSIRYRGDVTPEMRVQSEGVIYQIEAATEGPGRRVETLLVTTTEKPARV